MAIEIAAVNLDLVRNVVIIVPEDAISREDENFTGALVSSISN
jgi:hypothetical protein